MRNQSSHRPGEDPPLTLLPGVAIPVVSYLAALGSAVGAVILAIIAHAGKGASMPPAGDWRAIGDRLLAGEICAVAAWAFYKAGSQKIILEAAEMRIITWGLVWKVRRDEIADVVLSPSALIIRLADGNIIRPSMFWSSGPGMLYFQIGVFRNAMSREEIRKKILRWRQVPEKSADVSGVRAEANYVWSRCRVRANLPLLLGLAAVIATEAAAVTAWW